MKKTLLAIAALSVIAILGVFIFVDDFDIEISESQVQSAMDKRISGQPIVHLGTNLQLQAASIDFLANNTAQLDVKFDASGFGYGGKVAGNMATGINYKAPKLYLANLQFDNLDIDLDASSNDKLKDISNVAKDFIKRQREEMLTEEARKSLDNLITGDNSAVKKRTEAAIEWFFTTIPIYDLNNAGIKGSAASLALKEVRFTETSAIVTLSPRQAIIKIITFCIFVLLALVLMAFYFLPGHLLGSAIDKAVSPSVPKTEEE